MYVSSGRKERSKGEHFALKKKKKEKSNLLNIDSVCRRSHVWVFWVKWRTLGVFARPPPPFYPFLSFLFFKESDEAAARSPFRN